jgi:hypothetical protein
LEPLPPVKIEGKDKYFIEAILNSRVHRWKLQYLVEWLGYNQPDWEPTKLDSKYEAIDTSHEKYTGKPGPLLTQLKDITSLELSPNRGILIWPIILKFTIHYIMMESHTQL